MPEIQTKSNLLIIQLVRNGPTFCRFLCPIDRKEPKKIGNRAITTRLEYAISNPSGVAAPLPVAVALLAVAFCRVAFTSRPAPDIFDDSD